ncbi:MAG: DUF4376 domain-containing protein [Gemmobacter sp.]
MRTADLTHQPNGWTITDGAAQTVIWMPPGATSEAAIAAFESGLLPPNESEIEDRRREAIRLRRDRAIDAGTTVGAIAIQTDNISQSRIIGAALQAVVDPDVVVRWKTANGFVSLDSATIIALATAVRAHVQACFDREAELLADQELDIEVGWP